MLRAALRSLAHLNLDDINFIFLIIENNAGVTVGPAVEEFATVVGKERVVVYAEPRLGIAFARNRALNAALALNARWLAFIDDDEIAEPQWLAVLLREAQYRKLHLVGGLVKMQALASNATAMEKMVWRGLDARCRENEARGRRLLRSNRDDRITITTGNWLADLAFIRDKGLQFDEEYALSSGEDTVFFRALRKAGGKTGWTPDAAAFEEWPRERLTLSYQHRRARDQTLARHRAKYPNHDLRVRLISTMHVLFKTVGGIARTIQALFDGGASLVRAARAFGAAAGIVDALRSRDSCHYETTSGD